MTKVFGSSDDLIEFEGDMNDEVDTLSRFGETEGPFITSFDDNTKVQIYYNKEGLWKIKLLVAGHLFNKIDECLEEKDGRYSDFLFMKDGLNSYKMELGTW